MASHESMLLLLDGVRGIEPRKARVKFVLALMAEALGQPERAEGLLQEAVRAVEVAQAEKA